MSITPEHELTPELRELEQQLSSLVPSSVPQSLLGSMEQSMSVTDTNASSASHGFDELEVHLGHMAPATMPTDMLNRMVRAMDRWHEQVPVEEKVVPFGESGGDRTSAGKKSSGGMLAAAAAVAMLGAAMALVSPHFLNDSSSQESTPVAGVNRPDNSALSMVGHVEPHDAWLIPDSLSHNVTNTSDNGVIIAGDNTPHRCIRVDYIDRVKVQDDQGREFEIKRPGVRYMLLPVETN
ncbi:MAG: hypothetical protein H7A51_08195 [Akkermansiaceae bacterium]|nr:hypothetical protein [Akkermansiaceae bacterium]